MADKPTELTAVDASTTEQQTSSVMAETAQENNFSKQDQIAHQQSTTLSSSSLSTSSSINASQAYSSYEDLQQQSDDPVDLNKIIASLTNIAEWRTQFYALESLRILNKFHDSEKFIEVIFPECLVMVLELVDSIRSNLSKNALLLISEILMKHPTDKMPEKVTRSIIVKLFEKLISDKQFVRIEVETALERLHRSSGNCNLAVISTLVSLVFNKNPKISENAGNSLLKIIQNNFKDAERKVEREGQEIEESKENDRNLGNNYDQLQDKETEGILVSEKITMAKSQHLDQEILSVLMPSIVKCLNGKRTVLKRLSSQIANLLYQAQGINIIDSLSVEEQKIVMANINQHSSNSNKLTGKPSFRDFIAAKKQQHQQEEENDN